MTRLFLLEKWSWLCFFIFFLVLANILFRLDAGLASISVSYFNGLSCLFFFLFVCWRYTVETKQLYTFLHHIEDLERQYDQLSPFQQQYVNAWMNNLAENALQVNKMTIRLQEEKDDLLAWVHEVKTPLTAMKLSIEKVADHKLQTKLEQEWLRLFILLDQQLHQTRLDSIEKDNRMDHLELREVVFSELQAMKSWYFQKGIGVEYEGLEIAVYSDRKWLAFIIRQLLTNAVKYSYENEDISIFTSRNENGYIELHIEDKGIGIRSEDLPRIFRKSYTGNIGRESAISSGMGLYLAKNAADKLGINLSIESREKQGTRATLTFPKPNEFTKIIVT